MLGAWEFREGKITYVRQSARDPSTKLADEELLQEIHDLQGCAYCGVRNCIVPIHQAARSSKDQLLEREVNWRTKNVSNEVCGDAVHSIADCGMFGEKYVYHNNIHVAAAVHNVHCIQADDDRLKRVRLDQLDLEVIKEQERLQKLKRKVCTNTPVGMLEIDRDEVSSKYSKTETKCESWGDDSMQVPKSSISEGNNIRQEWNLGI